MRAVLQLIADFTELNLVASDSVTGNITLRLQNVPWDQALDLVLKTKGLDKRQVGNVLLVAPADEIAARERQELEAQKQIAELAPLRRELIQVNYAKAADIAKLFASVTAADADSQRGSLTVDERTNSIIALETQQKLGELRRIVTQLDIPVRKLRSQYTRQGESLTYFHLHKNNLRDIPLHNLCIYILYNCHQRYMSF